MRSGTFIEFIVFRLVLFRGEESLALKTVIGLEKYDGERSITIILRVKCIIQPGHDYTMNTYRLFQ